MRQHVIERNDTEIREVMFQGFTRIQGTRIELAINLHTGEEADAEIIQVEVCNDHFRTTRLIEMDDCFDLGLLPRAAVDSLLLVSFCKENDPHGALSAAFSVIASKSAKLQISNIEGDKALFDLRIGEFHTSAEVSHTAIRNFLEPV